MVLFAIVGELGSGKTLALTFLAVNNFNKKGRRIYSNYTLYGIPFTPIRSMPNLDKMKNGFFAGDELWLWCDSARSLDARTLFVNKILLKSRKREITIAYTTQSIGQIHKRIRDVTDFVAYPLMSVDNTYCRLEIFRGNRPSMATRMKPPIYFETEPIYAVFNTYEEVQPIKEEEQELEEIFIPIMKNPAWIRYMREKLGITSIARMEKYSKRIEKIINPEGITSSEQLQETF